MKSAIETHDWLVPSHTLRFFLWMKISSSLRFLFIKARHQTQNSTLHISISTYSTHLLVRGVVLLTVLIMYLKSSTMGVAFAKDWPVDWSEFVVVER